MAINPSTQYPGRITTPTTAFPYGSSKNETSPGAGDGTPYELARANDIFGFQQALLKAAGIVPSGNPDEVGDAEYLQAVVEEAMGRASYVVEDAGSAADAYLLKAATNNEKARSYFEGMALSFIPAAANTTASTVNAFGLGIRDIKNVQGGALTGGEIRTNARNVIVYDAINGWFVLLRPVDIGDKTIQPIAASVAANALTVTLNPTVLDFRSVTLTDGSIQTRTVSTAISMTVSSGSTLGTVNGVAARLAILAIDNAGTVEIAIANLAGGVNLDETTLISTTAEGGAGGADSANVIYSTTARANVPFRVVGFIDITEATAGTWATAPTLVQGAGGNAITAMQSLGFGQTRQDVTGSRTKGTTYYNTTGKPIMVEIISSGSTNATYLRVTFTDGSTLDSSFAYATGARVLFPFVVTPGMGYTVADVVGTNTITKWQELR